MYDVLNDVQCALNFIAMLALIVLVLFFLQHFIVLFSMAEHLSM